MNYDETDLKQLLFRRVVSEEVAQHVREFEHSSTVDHLPLESYSHHLTHRSSDNLTCSAACFMNCTSIQEDFLQSATTGI